MMNLTKYRSINIFSFLLLFVAIVSAPVYCAETTIEIYHTTDLHDASTNLSRIALYVSERKQQNSNVLFVDTGDWFNKGDLTPLETRGEAITCLMGEMGYDATIPGNHDYSFGTPRLLELVERFSLPLLACNVIISSELDSSRIKPYEIFLLDGITVGVIGLATHYDNHKIDDLMKIEFDVEKIASIVNAVDERADIVVLLTHLGGKADAELAKKLPNVDVIFGGHDHRLDVEMVYDEETKTIIQHSGKSGTHLGCVVLTWDGSAISKRETRVIEITPDMPVAENVEVVLERYRVTVGQ